MKTWISDNFEATGQQVLGIERNPLDNQVRACPPVPMDIHCRNCNHSWNPALRPMTLSASGEFASNGQNVTCPECQYTGELRLSSR